MTYLSLSPQSRMSDIPSETGPREGRGQKKVGYVFRVACVCSRANLGQQGQNRQQ